MAKRTRAPKRRHVYDESPSDTEVVEDMPQSRRSKKKKVASSHLAKMSRATNTALLPIEIMVMIMEHLHPHDMFHMASLCKALWNALTYECIIRNSILLGVSQGKKKGRQLLEPRSCMSELMNCLITKKSIHIPSRFRLLRLMNGKTCEMPGCSNPVYDSFTLSYGVFACNECLEAWTHDCSKGRYGKLLRHHLFYSPIRQSQATRSVAWRAPHCDGSGDACGPIVTMHHADRFFRGETMVGMCAPAANNHMHDEDDDEEDDEEQDVEDDDDPSTESSKSVFLLLKTTYKKAEGDIHALDAERAKNEDAAEVNRKAMKQEQLNDYLRRRLNGGVWEDIARAGMCQVGFVLARFDEADARIQSHQLSRGTLDKIISQLQPYLDLLADMGIVDVSVLRRRPGSTALHPVDAFLVDHWTTRQNDPKSLLQINGKFLTLAESEHHGNECQRTMESLWYRFQGSSAAFPELVTMVKTLNPELSSVDAQEIQAQWDTANLIEKKVATKECQSSGRGCKEGHPWLIFRNSYTRAVQVLKASSSLPCPKVIAQGVGLNAQLAAGDK